MDLGALLDKPKEGSENINVNNDGTDLTGIINRIEMLEKSNAESNKRLEFLEKMGEGINKKVDEDINIGEDNNKGVNTPQNDDGGKE